VIIENRQRELARALALSESFMKKVIAELDNDWTLTDAEIERAIKTMQ